MKEMDQKLITDLIQITTTIEKVYETLAKYKIQDNEPKYQETLQNLNLCLELEEKIYQKIKLTPQNFDKKFQQLKRIFYLQGLKTNSKEEKRIFGYITILSYLNPFLSMAPVLSEEYQENTNIIINQYSMDYCYQLIHLLEEQIQSMKNLSLKRRIIQTKYNNIFINKVIEPILLTGNKITLPSRREACILFSQDQELVNSIYESESQTILTQSLNTILNIDTIQFDTLLDKEAEKILNYIDIEVALTIISEETLNKLYNDYEFYYLIDPIFKTRKEVRHIDKIFKKIKSKKKVSILTKNK